MVAKGPALRKTFAALLACLAVVLLPSEAWAVDCVGPDDPVGCTPVASASPTPTVTVTATPDPAPTVTATVTAPAPTAVFPSGGVLLAPEQVVTSQLTSTQLSLIVAGIGLMVFFAAASIVLEVRGAHVA
jgi:hypothetical protein